MCLFIECPVCPLYNAYILFTHSLLFSPNGFLHRPSDQSTNAARADALVSLERLEGALEQESAPLSANFLADTRSNLAAMTLDQPFGKGLPFAIPKEYRSFPYLTGRATIALEIESSSPSSSSSSSDSGLEPILIEVDGYNAPLTAGRVVMLASQVGRGV